MQYTVIIGSFTFNSKLVLVAQAWEKLFFEKRMLLTMFSDRACRDVARGTFELTPAPGTCRKGRVRLCRQFWKVYVERYSQFQ